MTKANLTIKVDRQTKTQARQIAEAVGLSLGDLVDIQLKQMIKTSQIYSPSSRPLSPEFAQYLREINADFKAGRNLMGPFKTLDEVFEALNLESDD